MKYIEEVGRTIYDLFMTLVVAGVALVALGIAIFLYPPLLPILVAIGLILFGIVLWVLAYKTHKLWRKLPNFMK